MKRLLLLFIVSVFIIGCSNETTSTDGEQTAEENKTVSIFLDWTPNTNHTGIYVAKENGFYHEAGLDVEILLPGEVSTEQLVASERGDFGISFQTQVTQARAEDLPVVSIAAILQHDTSGYASPVEKEIERPEDFNGKVYGAYGSMLEESMIKLVMARDEAEMTDVEMVQLGNADFFIATQKDIDFVSIFYGWTGVEAEIRGIDLNFIPKHEYADELDTYAPLLITNEKMIAEDPETVQSFIDATMKGYQFAINNPMEAAEILINAEPDLDPELVTRSQEWLSPRYQDDADIWGMQEEERWQVFADFMYDNGIIEHQIDATGAFTNEFIRK